MGGGSLFECVCVCVCVQEKEKAMQALREGECVRAIQHVPVRCVCVCLWGGGTGGGVPSNADDESTKGSSIYLWFQLHSSLCCPLLTPLCPTA